MNKKAIKKRVLIYDEEGLKLLASSIKGVRASKGYTQEDLAYESGLSLSQIARIETCKINPTVSTIFQIARTLKVNVSELFDFRLK
ncbi:MAG: helix-turn-helix transcriptional regulator [Sphingobacteriaceae bacterium]|nr:helix-turn-helix transcriptional regulator [Sphingobacteriaceae bacterium]